MQQIVAWLEYSLAELDQHKRSTSDGVLLRQQQGAAQTVAELVDYANGVEKAIARAPANTAKAAG